jgi:hypothetical protein
MHYYSIISFHFQLSSEDSIDLLKYNSTPEAPYPGDIVQYPQCLSTRMNPCVLQKRFNSGSLAISTQNSGRGSSSQRRKINGSFRVPIFGQNATFPCTQWEYMPRASKVNRLRVWISQQIHGLGSIDSTNSSCNT